MSESSLKGRSEFEMSFTLSSIYLYLINYSFFFFPGPLSQRAPVNMAAYCFARYDEPLPFARTLPGSAVDVRSRGPPLRLPRLGRQGGRLARSRKRPASPPPAYEKSSSPSPSPSPSPASSEQPCQGQVLAAICKRLMQDQSRRRIPIDLTALLLQDESKAERRRSRPRVDT